MMDPETIDWEQEHRELSSKYDDLALENKRLKETLKKITDRMDQFHRDYDTDLVWREDDGGCPYTHDFVCDSEDLMDEAARLLSRKPPEVCERCGGNRKLLIEGMPIKACPDCTRDNIA